ncbi:MAG: ATPase [Flavobacteriales bacterium]
MRVLIADSGSTKCDWQLLDESGKELAEFHTMGFNPYFHTADLVEKVMGDNADVQGMASDITNVFFYGAGSSSAELCSIIQEGLQRVFPAASVVVDHDLVGAAYSTFDGRPGITCIIGTGSNSCHFDGSAVLEEVPALAYILGDEASGSWHGKKLLAAKLYHKLPAEVAADFDRTYGFTKSDIIDKVYREPDPNVFLASFMTFIGKHKEQPLFQAWLKEGFQAFIDVHVKCFSNWQNEPVHFIGSVAYHFQEELRAVCDADGVTVGAIIKKPIDGLASYHLKHILPSL